MPSSKVVDCLTLRVVDIRHRLLCCTASMRALSINALYWRISYHQLLMLHIVLTGNVRIIFANQAWA